MTQERFSRPLCGGTLNGVRPDHYDYWRVGYGDGAAPGLDFWIERAGEFHCKPSDRSAIELEMHRWTRLFYVTEGEGEYTFNQQMLLLNPGDLLILPPNHSCVYSTTDAHHYHWFAMAGKWPEVWGATARIWHIHLGIDLELTDCFETIREVLITRAAGFPYQALSAFYRLLARIELLRPRGQEYQGGYPEAVQSALAFLAEHCLEPFDSAAVAAWVCVSPSHLRALFDRWVGESPKRVHTRYRIERAKHLLNEQRLPIRIVAGQVGFDDVGYFSRVFKQMVGQSPSQYMKMA